MGKLRPRDGEGIGHTMGQWTQEPTEALRLAHSPCGFRQVLPLWPQFPHLHRRSWACPRTLIFRAETQAVQLMESPVQNMLEGLVEGGMSSCTTPPTRSAVIRES